MKRDFIIFSTILYSWNEDKFLVGLVLIVKQLWRAEVMCNIRLAPVGTGHFSLLL